MSLLNHVVPSSCFAAEAMEKAKQVLKVTTEQTVKELGAFGAPWLVVWKSTSMTTHERKSFFGSDRFEAIAHYLNLEYHRPATLESRL